MFSLALAQNVKQSKITIQYFSSIRSSSSLKVAYQL